MANKPVKSPLQKMIDDQMVQNILTGKIFDQDEAKIKDAQETVKGVLDAFKQVAKTFDQKLVDLRKVNGSDHLKDVGYFRKPRESKEDEGENPIVGILSL